MEAMESEEVVVVSPDVVVDNNCKSRPAQASKSTTTHYQKYYKQAYRTSWESQPDFKGWLRGVEGQPLRAYCSYCQVTLFAHRLSLLKHICTRKHQKAAHKIFLKHLEKGGSANDTGNAVDEDSVEEIDPIAAKDQRTSDQSTSVVNEVDSVERLETMEELDLTNKVQLRLKQKMQPASGMTVTIIREDGTTDPLHLEVTDYSAVHEEIDGTVPVTVMESTQPETIVESSEHGKDKKRFTLRNQRGGDRSLTFVIDNLGAWLVLARMPVYRSFVNDRIVIVERNPVAAQSTMAQSRPLPLTTHVLDTSRGAPVHGIKVTLYRLIDGRWTLVNESITSPDGRCNELIEKANFVSGRYKLHFDVDRYFELQRQESMYPFVEIVFDVHSPQVHYHIPLLISPYGYTTYRGS